MKNNTDSAVAKSLLIRLAIGFASVIPFYLTWNAEMKGINHPDWWRVLTGALFLLSAAWCVFAFASVISYLLKRERTSKPLPHNN